MAAVLAHAEECRRRRDELVGRRGGAGGRAARRSREAREELDAPRRGADAPPARAAAGALAEAVRERLASLAMDGATFEAALSARDGYGPSGGDEVEFLIAPNPGVPAGPLREIASGGELSRVMLALMGAAAEAGPRHAGVRRGRRRDRRPDRARRRRAAARRSRAAAR